MAKNNEEKATELEQGWTSIQMGITKLTNLLEGVPEQQFSPDEYMNLYTITYNLCNEVKRSEHNMQQLYVMYKKLLEEYLHTKVFLALKVKHGEFMLRELVKRWDNFQVFMRWLSHFSAYLERFYIGRMKLPYLKEIGFKCFFDQVYAELKINFTEAVLTLIYREREGEQIDRDLLKSVLIIFVKLGAGSMEVYENDFESELLPDTVAYYSRKAAAWIEQSSFRDYMIKAQECLKTEKERIGHYLHPSSQPKLLEIVQHELLTKYQNQLLEKERLGFLALLRDDKAEDIFKKYGLFCRIPNGLDHIAVMFRQHVEEEGKTLVKQAEDAASNLQAEKKDAHSGQEQWNQAHVRNVIELHDKYSVLVREYFPENSRFNKALKKAFEVFCNISVAGITTAELLVIFCDNLLKKGGFERIRSDNTIEYTMEKVVKLFSHVSDKVLFAEFYRKSLARRLLFDRSAKDEHEKIILTMLKQECGGLFTSKMEGMVADLALTKENQVSFEEFLKENSTCNPGIGLNVKILTSGKWPDYRSSYLELPPDMVKCVDVFTEFYQRKEAHRKLTWLHSQGTVIIDGIFDLRPIELIVTTYQAWWDLKEQSTHVSGIFYQAAVLLLFNAAERLSYADIKGQLNLTEEDTVRLLYSLSCAKYKILNKDPSTKTVALADSFEFNNKFTNRMRRIKIPLPSSDEKTKVIEDVHNDKLDAIDASIVRIMKIRKVLPYAQVLLECIEDLRPKFKPDVKVIKKRIESLILRDYLERDQDDGRVFRYLA